VFTEGEVALCIYKLLTEPSVDVIENSGAEFFLVFVEINMGRVRLHGVCNGMEYALALYTPFIQ
jgi:hypothetical protein